MEEIWIDRQADYVKYLWEEYQKSSNHRYTQHDARAVWRDARKSVKAEFDGFRNQHTKAEKKINTEKKVNKQQMTKELIERIKLGSNPYQKPTWRG
jgi:hypothetical protein